MGPYKMTTKEAQVLSRELSDTLEQAPIPKGNPLTNFWYRHRRLSLLFIVMLLVAIALSIGLAVGLRIGPVHIASGAVATLTNAVTPATTLVHSLLGSSVWQPATGTTYQIILQSAVKVQSGSLVATPNVQAYDIDMFANSADTINTLHKQGVKVICYFSAGSYEGYRPDSNRFLPADLGKVMNGWPDERWLNVSTTNVRSIMTDRIKTAASKGCDAIDPDNVDGYQADTGMNLTTQDSINFISFLSTTAASYNMSTGLKNAGDIIPNVLPAVHFSINEQCSVYNECGVYSPFVQANKAVFRIEYPTAAPSAVPFATVSSLCSAASSTGMTLAMKDMNLDGWVEYCDGSTATTSTQ